MLLKRPGNGKAYAAFSLREVVEATHGELIAGNPGESFSGVSIDSRTVKKGDIFIAIKGSRFDGHDFVSEAIGRGASCVIVSARKAVVIGSRISASIIMVKDTLSALTSMAYNHRKRFGIPVICITGSNGKTTTKEMLAGLLSSKYNVLKNEGTQNNIIGLSLALLRLRPEHEMAVLELGTNHFGEIKELVRIAAASVGIITNIGPAHLEAFKDENGVLKEKWGLIDELCPPAIAVLNADDALLAQGLSRGRDDVAAFTFGIKNKADFMAKRIIRRDRKISFMLKNYPITLKSPSLANVYNALAACAAARIFSVDAYDIIHAFRQFRFPDSRFQIKKIEGLNVIDDAYNANPASFLYAVDAFAGLAVRGRKIVVVGDMLELGKAQEALHKKCGQELGRAGVDAIVGIGPLSHIICDAAVAGGFDPGSVYKCFSAKEARSLIGGLSKKGDTVLLKGSRAMRLEEIFK